MMKLSILFLITFLSLWNSSTAQSLKTYSGKFKEGTAIYTYRDNPNGGRIFEGNFTYTTPYDKINGQFKDNKKDGVWTYKGINKLLKLSYKDGVPDGMYQFIKENNNYYSHIYRIDTLLLIIKDGKFIGSAQGTNVTYRWRSDKNFDYAFDTKVSFTGQFDDNGYLDGNWTFKTDDSITVFHATYEHGVCQKCYREDLTTGDIISGKGKLDLYSIIEHNFNEIEQKVARGHNKWNKYTMEQEKSTHDIQQKAGSGTFDLSYRSLINSLPYPIGNVTEQGRVVVNITVNPTGNVIATSINPRTNTTNTALHNVAMKAAQKARFNTIDSTNNQQGTITYHFESR